MPPILYLIDGHALAYRMYFALTSGGAGSQRWQTSKGEPTAGTYGFARELVRILEQDKPEYLAVAFDTGKTFRDQLYPAYKATREKMPDDLRLQIERIRQLVDAFNIPRLEMEGYEADDVLGTVARQAGRQGLGVRIVTGDRDLLQLVDERTAVYVAGDDRTYVTPEDVQASKFGVRPEQVVDYKAIVGDPSDNIPGVPGVGEKTALGLLGKYRTLDEVYAHLEEVENRWRVKLEAGRASAYLSRDLATIRTDLPLQMDLERARARDFDPASVTALLNELEFRSLVGKVEALTGAPAAAPARGRERSGQLSLFETPASNVPAPLVESSIAVRIVDTGEKLAALAAELKAARVVAFDTETTSTEEMKADLVGISLAVQEGEGIYIPVGHRIGQNLPLAEALAALRPSMTNPKIGKVAHNAKYDFIVLAKHGLRVEPITFDTMLAEFVVDPSSRNMGLKNLAFTRLGAEMTHIEDLIGKGRKQVSMADVAVDRVAPYAAADAESTLRLLPIMQAEVKRVSGEKIMDEIDMPLTPVLAEMEMTGVLLDLPFFQKMSVELAARLAGIERDVYAAVGREFNINSTQQLSDVLFNRIGLKPDASWKTASGFYSTNAEVLEALSGQHPVVDMVLEQRELSKLKSTYVDALPLAVDEKTGRVHTSYSQIGAVTGRLSSNNPNLQNIPIRSDLGRRVRNGFIAGDGNVLLSVDYSQIELRIVAHMAQDAGMLAAFRAGQDIHATTAAAIYNIPLAQVDKDQRRHAKAINFGLIYGMSAFGLTRTTELTLAEAEDFVREYFREFPGIKKYLDGIRRSAAELGYVETLLGRRRYFPALMGQMNRNLKNREEREAINAPIQGTAADIMKIAMLKIPPALETAKLEGRMLLQVHDELVLECPRRELEATVRLVKEVMASAYRLDIPLETEARAGLNWGEMQVVG
ncbi:MAG: DNA polymerase I [Chloroflexi bacterium]|nr:DNA polymerase I [Chloroflexota bacterium]